MTSETLQQVQVTKGRNITGWVLTGLVLAGLMLSGLAKVTQAEQIVEALGNTGYGGFIPLLGAIELAVVVLFLLPLTRGFGAFAVVAYLGGVIAMEWSMGGPPMPGIALSVLFWIGLYLRNPHLFNAR